MKQKKLSAATMMLTVLCCMSMPISGHAQAPVTPDAAQTPTAPAWNFCTNA